MTSETQTTEPQSFSWPKRWHPLKAHREQERLVESDARFKIVPAGRRSGKTEFAKRHLVWTLLKTLDQEKEWDDPRFFAAAPTRDQAKRIWWQDLKKLVPKEAGVTISESELCIRTWWGAELWVVGLDKAERIEGVSWDGGIIDELANCKPGIWDANIRPALADRGGWAWLIGVPDMDSPGQVEYEGLVNRALSKEDPDWECFSWPSADILPPEEVESARRSMDPRIFRQEYEGEFVLVGGRAFPDFKEVVHVHSDAAKSVTAYDPALPICWSLDFNVNPLCSGIIQHVGGEVRVIDEIELPDTVTPMAVKAFLARAADRGWNLDNLCIYGDASGNARRTTADQPGMTDWILVRNELQKAGVAFRMKVPNRNPPLPDTRNALNGKLLSADGKVSLYVAAHCRRIIQDLRSALWPSPDDWAEAHCLAWLRYFVSWEYPVRSTRVTIMAAETT